jgi:hypothetical protein
LVGGATGFDFELQATITSFATDAACALSDPRIEATLQVPRVFATVFFDDDELVVVSGNAVELTTSVERFRVTGDGVLAGPSILQGAVPSTRRHSAVIVVGNIVNLVGGADEPTVVRAQLNGDYEEWIDGGVTTLPSVFCTVATPTEAFCTGQNEPRVFLIGVSDTAANAQQMGAPFQHVVNAVPIVVGDTVVVLGGQNMSDSSEIVLVTSLAQLRNHVVGE